MKISFKVYVLENIEKKKKLSMLKYGCILALYRYIVKVKYNNNGK